MWGSWRRGQEAALANKQVLLASSLGTGSSKDSERGLSLAQFIWHSWSTREGGRKDKGNAGSPQGSDGGGQPCRGQKLEPYPDSTREPWSL